MKFFTLLLFSLISAISFGQTITFNTRWEPSEKRCYPCEYNTVTGEASAMKTIQLNYRGDYDFTGTVQNISYEIIELPVSWDKKYLPSTPNVAITFGKSRNENFIIANYNPIINDNGVVKMAKEITVEVVADVDLAAQDREFEFATTSVLSSGDWYKVGVSSTGVHQLTYDNLAALGIPVASVNPNHINIYGNHTPELPFNNSIDRQDDLVKNSILIQGDGDLSFDNSDVILFYATGPDNVIINSSSFSPRKNRIDSLAYYFIHVDASDPPKRVGTVNSTDDPVTHTPDGYDDYALIEENEENLLKSGDGWFGQFFEGSVLTADYSVVAENRITTAPITLKTAVAADSKSGTSGFRINVNGTEVDDLVVSNSGGPYVVGDTENSTVTFSSGATNLGIDVTFYRSSAASEGWLDYLQFNFRRKMRVGVEPILIRDFSSVGTGNVARYTIENASSDLTVWEVTDPYNVRRVNGSLVGSNYGFILDSDSLRTFAAFRNSQLKSVVLEGQYLGKIPNQNLHGLAQVDYLIVTHESLRPQAERLANLHRAQGTSVHVINIQQVYNEFGGGAADPVAVRWITKMFYDRAALDPANEIKYLCLFGDGTYDPLNRLKDNNYLMPTYNSPESGALDFVGSFTADDFFGLLDDTEAMGASDLLDVGIGRIPASTLEEAENIIDKVEHYMNYGSTLYTDADGAQCDETGFASTLGDWRNRIVLVADDENNGQFVKDCESLSDTTEKYHPEINIVKIYMDAYKQVVTSGGQRYPDVDEAINQNMNKGALVINYVGHGGETGLAQERVVSIPQIQGWSNVNNMTLFISATCEFSRFDDPERVSAGEITLKTPTGGAVALLTTTRLVYIFINTQLVQNLYTELFNELDGEPLALGEILRRTKNLTATSDNIRNFSLLGDPAMKLGKPRPNIVTDKVNGVDISMGVDTLKALSKITIEGHMEDADGNELTSYNGLLYPTIFDKKKTLFTLGQDLASPELSFDVQNNIIYKGKSTIKDGKFKFTFVVPKDINYAFGPAKFSYYGSNDVRDNYGLDTTVIVGGVDPNGVSDEVGPEVELFMNDEAFVNGGLTDSNPLFLAHINDENGINTTGNGIGHDITLIIDGNTAAPIILNNFYEADLDTYQSGKVSYRLSELEEGPHQITFKVWDVNNNSSEATLDFNVVKEEEIGISHLLNYPNPFTTNTDFYFEHNQVCNALDVKIEVFTVSGKLVKTIIRTVNTAGFRTEGINWDGRDDFGDKLARGVYVYRLSIETETGEKAEKLEKLVIL